MKKSNPLKEVARRLFIALETQQTAWTEKYGYDRDKWPQHMKDAMDALNYASEGRKWPITPKERD